MNYKPVNRRYHKARSQESLLPHFKRILTTLLGGSENVNGLFRKIDQTGFKNKRDLIDAIEILSRSALINKEKTLGNSIKMTITLTETGNLLAKLITSIETYVKAWKQLENGLAQKFNAPELEGDALTPIKSLSELRKRLERILKERGWTNEEVELLVHDNYKPSFGLLYLLEQSPAVAINILLRKYFLFLEMKVNEMAKRLISKIIIDLIATILQTFRLTVDEETNKIDRLRDQACDLVMDHITQVTFQGGFMYRFMNKEVTQVLDSMFTLAEPRKQYIKKLEFRIENTQKKVASREREIMLHSAREGTLEISMNNSMLKVIPFYQHVIKKWSEN